MSPPVHAVATIARVATSASGLVTALRRLYGGLEAIGCDRHTAWRITARIALECVPAIRTALIRVLLAANPTGLRTSDIAAEVGMVARTAHRHLEDLALLGLADRDKTSKADNAPDLWAASKWLRDHWPESMNQYG